MVTIDVSDVKLDETRMKYRHHYSPADVLKEYMGTEDKQPVLEASGGAPNFSPAVSKNGLLGATHEAFSCHAPLILSPDSIWLTVMQGVSRHVIQNAESLRKRFVSHDGKQELMIKRDNFVRGSPNNDWPGTWEEWSQQIKEKTVAKTYERLTSEFSTTTPLDRAISNLSLMSTMQEYFSYGMTTCCGIPKVTLLGEVADWKKLCDKASVLAEYDLGWWVEKMLPVLEAFTQTAAGRDMKTWWQSFYKFHSMSGGDTVDGHILKLFPFVKERKYDRKTKSETMEYGQRVDWEEGSTSEVPSGLLNVPFTWYYYDQTLPMMFAGGLVGIEDTGNGFKPACAWAVMDAEK